MSRLSLLMGIFLATSVTTITILIAIAQNIASNTIFYRGTIIFFIFGFLGTFFGSVLEVIFMPVVEDIECSKLHDDMMGEDKELQAELGDLLEEYKGNHNSTDNANKANNNKTELPIDDNSSTVVL